MAQPVAYAQPVAVAQPVPAAVAQPGAQEGCSCCATMLHTYGAIILILGILNIFSPWVAIPSICAGASLMRCCCCTSDPRCIVSAAMILNYIFLGLDVLWAIISWVWFSDQMCAWIFEADSADDYKDSKALIDGLCDGFAAYDDDFKSKCDTCDFYQGPYPILVIVAGLILCLPSAVCATLARKQLLMKAAV